MPICLRPETIAQSADDARAGQVVTPSYVAAGEANEARVQKLRREPEAGLVEGADPGQRQRIGNATVCKRGTGLPTQFAPSAERSERLQRQRVRHNERGADPRPAMDQHAENGVETDGARSDALRSLAKVRRKRVELGLRQAKSRRRFHGPVACQIEVIPDAA